MVVRIEGKVYESKSVSSLPPAVNEALKERQVNWVTFTSSSTARNFVKLLGKNYLEKLKNVGIASIGPITTATLNELAIPPTAVAGEANLDGLVEAICAVKIGLNKGNP